MESELLGLFGGMGFLAVCLVGCYFIYQLTRGIKQDADYEDRVYTLKNIAIERVATKRGIDLKKEIEKNKIMKKSQFRKKLEEQMFEDVFGKENKK